MTAPQDDPWNNFAAQPITLEQEVGRLTRALERERALRDRTERMLEDKTRALFLANEQLAAQHAQLLAAEKSERARLQRELQLAQRIQAAILPRDLVVEGLEIAAAMQPCSEMGGDYYDLRPLPGGCWIGIGDVAGHGVPAGLVMLMLQCVAAALTQDQLHVSPSAVLTKINAILHENIRGRMASNEHITASLLLYHVDGELSFAGAHEDIVVLRARTGSCELVETSGTWLGVVPDIRCVTRDQQLHLDPGDTVLLHTDGLTEAKDRDGQRFGVERVCAELVRLRGAPVREILDQLMAMVRAFSGPPTDDVTALVLRYTGPRRAEPSDR